MSTRYQEEYDMVCKLAVFLQHLLSHLFLQTAMLFSTASTAISSLQCTVVLASSKSAKAPSRSFAPSSSCTTTQQCDYTLSSYTGLWDKNGGNRTRALLFWFALRHQIKCNGTVINTTGCIFHCKLTGCMIYRKSFCTKFLCFHEATLCKAAICLYFPLHCFHQCLKTVDAFSSNFIICISWCAVAKCSIPFVYSALDRKPKPSEYEFSSETAPFSARHQTEI